MECLFSNCKSLTNINLSNFDTQKVTSITYLFQGCKSLKYVNLSNFTVRNDTAMSCVFLGCESLKKENIITKDRKILNEYLSMH